MNKRAKFITFEGGEGSGKSTQSRLLYEYLLSEGIEAIHTREIGGTKEAEAIRDLVIYSEIMPISELLLIMAARYEHVNKVIIPALRSGKWVICDRFVDSTAAYQSVGSKITLDAIYELHAKLITDYNSHITILPDITFFMDLDPKIGLNRANQRGETNKFEEKDFEFHQKLYFCFKEISKKFPDRFIPIDVSDKKIDEIHLSIKSKIL